MPWHQDLGCKCRSRPEQPDRSAPEQPAKTRTGKHHRFAVGRQTLWVSDRDNCAIAAMTLHRENMRYGWLIRFVKHDSAEHA